MEIPEPTNPWQASPASPASPATGTPARTRRPGRAIAFVAAGAIAATGITGLAFAADNGPTPAPSAPSAPSDSTAPNAPGGMMGDGDGGHGRGGPGGRGGMGGHGGLGLGGRVQHGEAVVTKDDGTTATVRVQSGTISSVSATELMVKSDDGFEQTWPLTAETSIHKSRSDATAADLAVGDTVMVLGEVKDGSVTTLRVGALTAAEAAQRDTMREKFEKDHPGGPHGDNDADGPDATTSGYTA